MKERPAERLRDQWEDKREEKDYNDPATVPHAAGITLTDLEIRHYTSHGSTNTHH